MKILVAVIIAMLASSRAMASDWWTVARTGAAPSRAIIFLDYESLQIFGTTRTVWLTTVQENTDPEEIRSKNEFECSDRRNRVTSFAASHMTNLQRARIFHPQNGKHPSQARS